MPALAAGNTVVVKPAEAASLETVRLVELMQEVFPPGVVNVVTGLGLEAGAALTAHPLVAKISFTGSTATGKLIQYRNFCPYDSVSISLSNSEQLLEYQ